LDTDATLVETQKREALWSYEGYKAYQPFNVWWAEQGVVLHTEFRDGNVPAGYEQLRVFQEALEMLPEGSRSISSFGYRRVSAMIFYDIVRKVRTSGLVGSSSRLART